MPKYTMGVLMTSFSAGVVVTALTMNFFAGAGAIGFMLGVGYMVSGITESVLKAILNKG